MECFPIRLSGYELIRDRGGEGGKKEGEAALVQP